MKLRCIDTFTSRSDGQRGGATDVTLGVTYKVIAVLDTQYAIVNDKGKMGRYSKYRFEVLDKTPPLPLEQSYNDLTHDVRMELKAAKDWCVAKVKSEEENITLTLNSEQLQALRHLVHLGIENNEDAIDMGLFDTADDVEMSYEDAQVEVRSRTRHQNIVMGLKDLGMDEWYKMCDDAHSCEKHRFSDGHIKTLLDKLKYYYDLAVKV